MQHSEQIGYQGGWLAITGATGSVSFWDRPMDRYRPGDDQWDCIKNLLPGHEGHVGVMARDNRLFVEAALYRYRAGINLARSLPSWPRAGEPRRPRGGVRSGDRRLSRSSTTR
jgi:hypothetical protein